MILWHKGGYLSDRKTASHQSRFRKSTTKKSRDSFDDYCNGFTEGFMKGFELGQSKLSVTPMPYPSPYPIPPYTTITSDSTSPYTDRTAEARIKTPTTFSVSKGGRWNE